MIDRRTVWRLTGVSAAASVLAAGALLALGRPMMAGGVGVGAVLGLIPFLSWTWMAGGGWGSRRRRILAVVVLGGKLGVYAGALHLLVTKERVSPIGVFLGITAVVAVFAIGGFLLPPRAGEQKA